MNTEAPSASLAAAMEMAARGYKIIPIPVGEKFPKGLSEWQRKATNDEAQVQDWWGHGERGIGWAMGLQPNGVMLVAIDVDVAGGKPGKKNFEAFVDQHGFGAALASTVMSVTGTGGYHFVFETTEPLTNGIFAEGVDVRGEGGFIVIPPSIHPNGERYRWIKSPMEVAPAPCPFPIVEHLTRVEPVPAPKQPVVAQGDTPADWVRQTMSIQQLLVSAGWQYMENKGEDGYWCRPGKNPRDGHSAVLHGDGPLVIWSTTAPAEFWRVGRDTSDGSRVLSVFEVYAAVEHHGDLQAASSYVRRNLMPRDVGPPAQVQVAEPGAPEALPPTSGLNLPAEFWESKPWLTQVRQAAWSRGMSPDAVLGALLSRVAAVVPVNYVIPPIVGGKATFDHLSVLVGKSGGGKSAAAAIAEELFPERFEDTIVWDFPAPSGEGLVEAFFEYLPVLDDDGKPTNKKEKRQTKQAVHFTVEEAMGLIQQAGRAGTTITSVICSAWAGQTIGFGNASDERKRVIKKGKARVSGLMGIQTKLGHHFLTDELANQGFSGRIVWFAAEDPSLPHWKEAPQWPGELDFRPLPVITGSLVYFEYPLEVHEEVLEAHHVKQSGKVVVDPLEGHQRLVQLKVSGLVAALEGRTKVTIEDWEIARAILNSSNKIRHHMKSLAIEEVRQTAVTQGTLAGMREMAALNITEARHVAAISDRIVELVQEDEGDGLARTFVRKEVCASTTGHLFDAALERAVQGGLVKLVPGRNRGSWKVVAT